MMDFKYKAKDKNGNLTRGKIKGLNEHNAVLQLHQHEFFILELKKTKAGLYKSGLSLTKDLFKKEKLNIKELSRFCRQLSLMLSSGISLINALEILLEHKASVQIDAFIRNLIMHLQEGLSLAKACELEKKKLPFIMINLITVGELGGFLDISLEQLADYFEKEIRIKNTLKTALTYPLIICLISLLALGIIFGFIIPVFTNMLKDIDQALPLATVVILKLSFYLREYWIPGFFLLFLCSLILYFSAKTSKGRAFLDRLLLRIPVIKEFYQKILTARFCYILAKLLASGIVLLEALEIVEKTIKNAVLRNEVSRSQENIKNGMSFTESLKASTALNSIALKMIAIGEGSGNLEELMKKTGEILEEEIEVTTERLPKLIEPFFIVILGIIVASIVLGVLMPMFSAINNIGNF